METGIGSVGTVIDDAKVKRTTVEIDNGVFGSGLVVAAFGDSRKIRAGFHFDDGEAVFEIKINERFIFEKGAKNSDGFLTSENGTLVVGVGKELIETVVEEVGILGVLVED